MSSAAAAEDILSRDAVAFVGRLHRELNPRRLELLDRRHERQLELDAGALPSFREDTNRAREENAQANLGMLRRTALSLLKNADGLNGSVNCKRKQAGWDDRILENVLLGRKTEQS